MSARETQELVIKPMHNNVVKLNTQENSPRSQQGRAAVVAGLDIGSSKITCLIGEARSSGAITRILGVGQTAARGIQAGAVSNIDEAEKAIRIAVDFAEKASGRKISAVHVGVAGGKPVSVQLKGQASVKQGKIRQEDADKAISSAVSQAVVGKRSVLGVTPLTYALDGVETQNAPIGLNGRNLSAEVGLVTVDTPFLLNLSEAVERAHLQPAGFVLAANASGRAVLEEDERALGAVLIDIGAALTSVAVFRKGRLRFSACLPVAGNHITQDIARAFSTSLSGAERLKTLHGNCLGIGDDERDMLAVPQLGERGLESVQQISRAKLTAVIRPRVEEILEMAAGLLKQSGMTADRAVLTGGTASLIGLRELARPVLGCETRIGQVPQVQGLQERQRQPSLSAAYGLLQHATKPDPFCALPTEAAAAIERQQLSKLRRVGRWIIESF